MINPLYQVWLNTHQFWGARGGWGGWEVWGDGQMARWPDGGDFY
ncbi:hypothetical protein BJP36_36725 [Moorena producens JHB]|uniref:Uncharacterized protein n=1 Tax=Moorena producens (strain JHB) TaxID=1454205 RepID=A0A9Q9SU29_MOOP1|nr:MULTISPECIES: hypothetical protein [Moorena]WAN69641.1 hypothetical protein BJP36_36725 [Moorena producens JHB]